MQLSLCRWDDDRGCSEGFWLVRQLPGAMLHGSRRSQDWSLVISDEFYNLHPRGPEEAWGKNFSTDQADRLIEINPRLLKPFPTRKALILELEATLLGDRQGSLSRELC